MVVSQEAAIKRFLNLARALQAETPLTGQGALERMADFYRTVRIENADFDADGDALLVQWGSFRPLLVREPIDLRNRRDHDAFDDVRYRLLDFTRQVYAPLDDADEFDDIAVHMSISLVLGPATGDEPSGNKWIRRPSKLERGLEKVGAIAFVAEHLHRAASRMVATVDFCG